MNEYLLLIHNNAKSRATAAEWELFIQGASASGFFAGGSEVGARTLIGNQATANITHQVVGYMRFTTDDRPKLLALLETHPVVRHGGTVELCELPKT